MPKNSSPSESVVSTYQQLAAVALDLNSVSDELGKSIGEIDSALRRLNLGISAWIQISGSEDPNTGSYWSEDIGYAKINGRWGIALRTVSGNNTWPEDDVEQWLFNEAPRSMRLGALESIPKLLVELGKAAADTAQKIKGRLSEAQNLAVTLRNASFEPRPKKNTGEEGK